ncbi:hypothetical protein RQP46_001862 [Phenoliferia psychrophenolica]
MTSLKMAIIRRNEDWEKGGSPTSITSPLPPPTTTSPALTLKNTVQPSTHSMTSTASPSASSKEAEALVKYAAAAASKTSRTAKFKKAFGVGKKGKSAGAMVEPGTAIEEEDGKEEKDWTMISGGRHAGPGPEVSVSRPSRDQPRDQLLRQQASYEHPRRSQEHLPVRRSTNSTSSSAGKMPMPGEDESDDELQGIAYSPAPGYGQQWQTGRPPSIASSNSQAPSPIAMLRVGGKGLNGMAAMSEVLEEDEILCFTEGGQPLRNVVLPAELMSHFVALSLDNTERGIETCGLLMGTLSHNTFTITNLLVPKQDGTPDTCTTTHEEEQFAYQDERELMTLGWIHTHPTQTCFMSSLDLHTHASYQVMLAEAIAIVCAPRHNPGYGIFRLTDPPGLETIVTCQLPGLFHPHPDLPIYTDTDHGHVQATMKDNFGRLSDNLIEL